LSFFIQFSLPNREAIVIKLLPRMLTFMIPELLGKMLQGFMIHVLLLLVSQHYNEVSFQKKIQHKKKMLIEMDLFRATNKSGAP
jgi:hypothetical protein